jgi:lipopolysaccharide transport system ATP-binding protein
MNNAIVAENLAKHYKITSGRIHHDTLRDQIMESCKSLFRRKYVSRREETFWALKDVSFQVRSGDVLGVIGRNGAGKSTLLKIISRITAPSAGAVEIRGRVGSLLEVGTGFHVELSGRENIFLNGAILGMKKAEIERKFDDIVAFAEVEKFIDTPVKRYSSGMHIRLAFAIAAHLEPEVLIVDEVLAVGDTAFQRKCLGKMEGVAKEGRTVLFVSHNMAAVQHLCKKVIMLENGKVLFAGETKEGIDHYYQTVMGDPSTQRVAKIDLTRHRGRHAQYKPMLQSVEFLDGDGNSLCGRVKIGAPLKIAIRFSIERPLPDVDACVGFETITGQRVFTAHTWFDPSRLNTACVGERTYICDIPSLTLVAGVYKLLVALGSAGAVLDLVEDAARLEILDADYYGTGRSPWNGLMVLQHRWHLQ